MCPEMRANKIDEISPYTKDILQKNNLKLDVTGKKLIADLHDKVCYKIHYLCLKFILEMGYVLKKVHRIVRFVQSPFLRDYVLKNTKCRNQATSDFEKSYFKLKTNSIFGKVR